MRAVLCLLTVFLCSCGDLLSVYPLATPETTYFDDTLVGEWNCTAEDCKGTVLIRPDSAARKYYDIVWIPGERDGEPLRLQGRLVKAGTMPVFDLVAVRRAELTIPGHFFLSMTKTTDGVQFQWLDSDWLRDQAKGPDGVAHLMVEDKPVITAGSAAISAFLQKFGSQPKASAGTLVFKRVLRTTG
jgi:hypothetical protein